MLFIRCRKIIACAIVLIATTVQSDIATNRSLAVTELDILSRFTLEDVLNQLITANGSQDEQSASELWEQWLATNADCEDFNGFPISCRADELVIDADPFSRFVFKYQAIGLFNRFDLASDDGSDCGEYRIVFARTHNDFGQEKTLIFESRLPNPQPELGLAGCASIARFWADLSDIDSNSMRADALVNFYFSGLPGVAPVLDPNHFGRTFGSGQVRTNSFIDNFEWSMREYGIRNECEENCKLVFVQTPTKENPFVDLVSDENGEEFQNWLIDSIAFPGENLLANSVSELRFPVPDEFNAGESLSPESKVFPVPITNIADNMSAELALRIEDKLATLGVTLTAEQVINRANSLTCNGCHHTGTPSFNGNNSELGFTSPFPDVDRFRHVQLAQDFNDAPDGPRHRMSEALKIEFLPFRKQVMETFLASISPLTGSLAITSEWTGGYCASVSIANSSAGPVTWSVDIDLHSGLLSNAWNANTNITGSQLNATGFSWNATIPASSSLGFGFCADKTSADWQPTIVSVNAI